MKFLINNANEAQFLFRKNDQGLMKLYVSLVGVQIWVCLQNKEFSLKRKNNVWGGFSDFFEMLFYFWGVFESSNGEKRGDNRRKGFYGEIWENTAWGWVRGGLVNILWDSPCMRVIWKLLNTFGWILMDAWLDFITKLQKCTPSACSRSTGVELKKMRRCFIYLNRGISHRLDEMASYWKNVFAPLRVIAENSQKFEQILWNPSWRLAEENIACGWEKDH